MHTSMAISHRNHENKYPTKFYIIPIMVCYTHFDIPLLLYCPGLTRVRSGDVYFLASHLCKNASHKWREIGLALNFLDGELKSISLSFPRATAQQLLTEGPSGPLQITLMPPPWRGCVMLYAVAW